MTQDRFATLLQGLAVRLRTALRRARYRPERRYMRGAAGALVIGLMAATAAQAAPDEDLLAYDRLLAHAESELREALAKPGAGPRLMTGLRGAEFAAALAPEEVARRRADPDRDLAACAATPATAAGRLRGEAETLARDALESLRTLRCAVAAEAGSNRRGAWHGGRAEPVPAFAFHTLRPGGWRGVL